MSATLRAGTLYIDGGVNKKNKFQYTHTHVLYFKNKINPYQTGTSRLPGYWNTTEQTIRMYEKEHSCASDFLLFDFKSYFLRSNKLLKLVTKRWKVTKTVLLQTGKNIILKLLKFYVNVWTVIKKKKIFLRGYFLSLCK